MVRAAMAQGMTMAQERPLLPPPHQVVAELWQGVTGQAVTSKRSLVYHGFVTFRGTMMGFLLGIVMGVALAVSIVRFRVMELSVMPWAIISQTIPIVALAPMILTVPRCDTSNSNPSERQARCSSSTPVY